LASGLKNYEYNMKGKAVLRHTLLEVKVNHSVWKAQVVGIESVFSWWSEYFLGECNDITRNPTIGCNFSVEELKDSIRDAKSR
jgi:hypothetical protein